MNRSIFPPNKAFPVLIFIVIFFVGEIYGQVNNSKHYEINPRIKSNQVFFGFEQIKIGTNNTLIGINYIGGYFYGGITRRNYNSIDPFGTLSFRHMAGISYNPAYNIAGIRLNSGISFLGISTRINIAYHTNFKNQSVILKPAVGIDFRFFTLHWGPNIILIHGLDKYFQKTNICFELSGYL